MRGKPVVLTQMETDYNSSSHQYPLLCEMSRISPAGTLLGLAKKSDLSGPSTHLPTIIFHRFSHAIQSSAIRATTDIIDTHPSKKNKKRKPKPGFFEEISDKLSSRISPKDNNFPWQKKKQESKLNITDRPWILPTFTHAFQCHRFGVNPTVRSEVMPVLLKSGQSASRKEAVEKMNACRSMVHLWCRSTFIPECGPSIFYDRLKPRSSHKLPRCPWTT
ncbi:hypothetical protein YC2023_087765 [Brassica napus]